MYRYWKKKSYYDVFSPVTEELAPCPVPTGEWVFFLSLDALLYEEL